MTQAARESSGPGLRGAMGVVGYFALAFGSMIGVGWIVVMHDWLQRGGPIGAAGGFLLGALLLVPVAIAYGRLTAQQPTAQSELGFTAGILPEPARFFVGWMMLLGYLVVCPYEGVAIGQLASALVGGLETVPLYTVGGATVYLPTLLLGLATVAAVTAINYLGVTHASRLQTALTFALLAGLGLFVVCGVLRGRAENLSPPFPAEGGAWLALLRMLQVVPYFLSGFETVSRCSEERASEFPPGRFVGVTLLALAVGAGFYVTMVLVATSLSPWESLSQEEGMATVVAFRQAFQSETLVAVLLIVALLSLVKVLNGCFLAATRQVFALARAGMLPQGLADVSPGFRTPGRAILLVGVLSAAGCFLGKAILVPISEVGSFAFAVGFLATCVAYCHPRWRTGRGAWVVGICGAVVSAGLGALKLIPWIPDSFSRWEYLSLGVWVLFGVALWGLRRAPAANVPAGTHHE